MFELPCIVCRVFTRADLLVDISEGAKPELACPTCADEVEADTLHPESCRCHCCRRASPPAPVRVVDLFDDEHAHPLLKTKGPTK